MSHADTGHFITLAVALLAILNPIGNAAIYLGMTDGLEKQERRNIVKQCSLGIAIILLLTVWFGPFLLRLFGISIGAFQSAGGFIVLLIALGMINAKPHGPTHDTEPDKRLAKTKNNIAIVPLAIPIIAGPGALSTIMINMHGFATLNAKLLTSLITLVCTALLAAALAFAPGLAKIMGHAGMKIVTRVMGLILAAIAFQMLGSGLAQLLPGLAG